MYIYPPPSVISQARDLAEKFGREERRMAYVTPTSYLELIQTFQVS